MKAIIYNHQTWVEETDPERLRNTLNSLLKLSGFGVLQILEHHFNPIGYTCIFLLSESHLAIHTFPEENTSYVELSSCVKPQFDDFVANFTKYIK